MLRGERVAYGSSVHWKEMYISRGGKDSASRLELDNVWNRPPWPLKCQPSDRLGARVRGRRVVDSAPTWSAGHLSSKSEAVSGDKHLACVRYEFAFFNICAVHGANVFDIDTLGGMVSIRL